jgi:hypothetical protein
MTLIAHRGGWEATTGDLASVPVPEETESYMPVPYPRLVEEVKLHIPRFGLEVTDEQYALAREGKQMFGVLTCHNGTPNRQYALAIGIRSSYDCSLAVELVAGSRVFVCDNLAFTGEANICRKHTVNVFRDLPDLIYRMLNAVEVMKHRQEAEFDVLQNMPIDAPLSHHLMIEAVQKGALPASKLPKVIEEWEHPKHDDFKPRTAWSLFNCFTEVQKSRSPRDQMDGTLRLSSVFREVLLAP